MVEVFVSGKPCKAAFFFDEHLEVDGYQGVNGVLGDDEGERALGLIIDGLDQRECKADLPARTWMEERIVPTEFARVVRIGLGRAILVLQREDPTPYFDLVVEACVHNQAYDQQVEGVRLDYVLDLIRLSGNPTYCRRRVLDALRTTHPDDDDDLNQLFALARAFAEEGDEDARAVMYARFATKASDPSLYQSALDIGGEQIVRLDGVDGFLFVAEHLGARILADEDLWADDYWLQIAEEKSGAEMVRREVERVRQLSPAVNAYLNSVEASRRETEPGNHRRMDWTALSYDELKPLISQGGRKLPIMGLVSWGMSADKDSLLHAAND